MKAEIRLPRPISVNNLYANVAGRGRVNSGTYNAWKWQAKALISEQKPLPSFPGPVSVSLAIGEQGVGRIDTDNCGKAYLDALVDAGVITDDNRRIVRRLAVEWRPGEGCLATVEEWNLG